MPNYFSRRGTAGVATTTAEQRGARERRGDRPVHVTEVGRRGEDEQGGGDQHREEQPADIDPDLEAEQFEKRDAASVHAKAAAQG